jgi:hypothetical protein
VNAILPIEQEQRHSVLACMVFHIAADKLVPENPSTLRARRV